MSLTFYFIGVTTRQSSIMQVFPLWMRILGRPDVEINGIDLKLHDEVDIYRRVVQQIKDDPSVLGALVTTHKLDLLDAARDLFDHLDSNAQLCHEVSCISKQDGRLEGHAMDPISAGKSLDAILGHDYFARTGGQVLCLGTGGSAIAIALHFARKANAGDRPARFIAVNRSQPRLDALQTMLANVGSNMPVNYVLNDDPQRNDTLMAQLPDGSLVINATGMGKDRPGSPVSDMGLFPRHGIAWELNYRGELQFLHQVRGQSSMRDVRVEDGWLYFLHGWLSVIAQVLHIDISTQQFTELALAADHLRPAPPPIALDGQQTHADVPAASDRSTDA